MRQWSTRASSSSSLRCPRSSATASRMASRRSSSSARASSPSCGKSSAPRPGETLFADMNTVGVGHNPARIISACEEFVRRHAAPGARLRGVGEPIFPERDADELLECQRHESLLNLAFAGASAFWLVCPYDGDALEPAVIDEAYRSHPYVARSGRHEPSAVYQGLAAIARPFAAPLPEPTGEVRQVHFAAGPLEGSATSSPLRQPRRDSRRRGWSTSSFR
jgi:hypothetical protein